MKKRLLIFYDVRMLPNSGIGTQIKNVLKYFNRRKDIDLHVIGDPDRIYHAVPDFQFPIITWRAPIYSIKEQYNFPKIPADALLISPHYNISLRYLDQSIVVIHDLIHLMSDEFESPQYRLYASFMLSRIAKKAKQILTVSNHTRMDVLSRYPEASDKTIVNLNGIDHDTFKKNSDRNIAEFKKKYSLPKRYLLTVGIGKKHKNIDFVLRSLLPFWQNETLQVSLVMAGTGGKLPDYLEEELKGKFAQDKIVIMPHITEVELSLLYSGAELLIMPSLLEGFGFPVLEAMACGTPVLSSPASSLPEVGGKAADFFDPQNPLDFTDRIFELTTSPTKRRKMIARGLKQAKQFSWETHCEQLLSTLHQFHS